MLQKYSNCTAFLTGSYYLLQLEETFSSPCCCDSSCHGNAYSTKERRLEMTRSENGAREWPESKTSTALCMQLLQQDSSANAVHGVTSKQTTSCQGRINDICASQIFVTHEKT